MGYIDDQFPLTDEPTNFLAVMAKHLANGVPTSSWVSLVNVGLSLTHFVSETFATGSNLVRGVIRGMFVDTILTDAQAAPDAATLATVTANAVDFALSQYQESLQPATFSTLRVELSAIANAPANNFTAGSVIAGVPSIGSNVLLYSLDEDIRLAPGGRVVAYFKATSPGIAYNLAAGSAFELKTTFVGVTASLPLSGTRYTFGSGNSSISFHMGANFDDAGGLQVGFRVQAPSVATATITFLTSPDIVWVNMRSDGASAPLSTAEECRALITSIILEQRLPGVQLPAGTDGSGVMAVAGLVQLAYAVTPPLEDAGQDAELAVQLVPRCIAKWDATDVGNGTDDALYYWATKAPAGYTASPVSQVQVLNITKPDGTIAGGYVTILVSGLLGPLSADDLAAVRANMINPRKNAAFTVLTVVNTIAHNITVTATVTYTLASKLVDADIASAIAASLLNLQSLLSMGVQTIDPSRIEGFIVAASTAITVVVLSVPAAPVALAWNERAVFVMSAMVYVAV